MRHHRGHRAPISPKDCRTISVLRAACDEPSRGCPASSVILLFALVEGRDVAVGARGESRSGGAPSTLRLFTLRPSQHARSHHIVTLRDLWMTTVPLSRGFV